MLLAIKITFKILNNYLKYFKYEIFVLINYNNLHKFMKTKYLS